MGRFVCFCSSFSSGATADSALEFCLRDAFSREISPIFTYAYHL